MTKKMFCLSSMADGEGILHNGTSSNETPRSLLSNKTPGSKDPSSLDNRPPVQTNADEPGSTNHSQTHIAGAGTPSSSSKTAPAPICTCGQELGYIPACQIGDEEFDSVIFTKRCEIHEQGKHGDFLDELRDFTQPGLRLNALGRMMQDQLWREWKENKRAQKEVQINPQGGKP